MAKQALYNTDNLAEAYAYDLSSYYTNYSNYLYHLSHHIHCEIKGPPVLIINYNNLQGDLYPAPPRSNSYFRYLQPCFVTKKHVLVDVVYQLEGTSNPT
jgi:hypothetical protein